MKRITKWLKETSLKQTLVGVHFAFSALFFISVFIVFLFALFSYVRGFNILVPLMGQVSYMIWLDLWVLTLFSVPGSIWLIAPWVAPDLSVFEQIYLVEIFMGFFYAFLAYGLLREKKAASAIALISNLLTIFAGIHKIFWFLPFGLDVVSLGFFASGITFNFVLVSLLLLSHIFQKFQKLKPVLLGLLVSTIFVNITFTFLRCHII